MRSRLEDYLESELVLESVAERIRVSEEFSPGSSGGRGKDSSSDHAAMSMNESLSIPIKSSSVDDKDDEEEDDDEEERRSSTSPANRAKDCKKKQHERKERVGGND